MNRANTEAIKLLSELIKIPSFSREEDGTAGLLAEFFQRHDVKTKRFKNNLYALNQHFDPSRPTVLLNSHHDTVRPNKSWTKDPFGAEIEDGKLFGLGSNDAGGALVALIFVFLHFYKRGDLKFNVIFAASAEEEITGHDGIELLIKSLPEIAFAMVGEPTQMQLAIAEKGLMVLDCCAHGKSGHAAREEGINAIYLALEDINWIKNYQFPSISPMLGPVKMTTTMIESGSQHNVVPDKCHFTIDVRSTDTYSNEDILKIIRENVRSEVVPRSTRLQPSGVGLDHPIVRAAQSMGISCFGSPTCSDQALMRFPSVKIGPGDSARSHTADEYIYIKEIEEGIKTYIRLLELVVN